MQTTGHALIFDADDTLWENNARYERVIEDYLDWIAHPTLDRTRTREILDEIEAANSVSHGYGSRVFLRSLRDCFARLNERPVDRAEAEQIELLAVALVEQQVELLPGVAETLEQLATRHDLHLLTKGDADEQRRKVDASELGHHFDSVHVVREKDVDTYHDLVRQYDLQPAATWMIGNSPRSDIVPARRAGLNAVYIPDEHPWVLEHAHVDETDERVLQLTAFAELARHF